MDDAGLAVVNEAPARSGSAWRWPVLSWLVLLAAILAAPAAAQEREAAEHAVKAAFVFRFGDYVEWPDGTFSDADAPLRIGVVGAEALAGELERIAAGLRVAGRRVVVVRPSPGDALDGLQMLFVGAARDVPPSAAGGAILTITETGGAPPPGSVINLFVVDGRVRFDVSLVQAQARGLRVSSRLLALARRVEGAP